MDGRTHSPALVALGFGRSIIRDSRTMSECHFRVFQRYFVFLFWNALAVFMLGQQAASLLLKTYKNAEEVLITIGENLPKASGP
jgi:hypothetical protein